MVQSKKNTLNKSKFGISISLSQQGNLYTLPKTNMEGPKMMGLGKGNSFQKKCIFGIYVRFPGGTQY